MIDISYYDYNDEDDDMEDLSHQPISSLSSNEKSYSASRYQTLRNISSTRRNCKAENIFTKNEENKILKADNLRQELNKQLALIRKKKKLINCNNQTNKQSTKKNCDKIIKKAKMNKHKYIKKLNKRRKKKKEAQQKQYKQKKNFFEDNNDYKPPSIQEEFPLNYYEEINHWHVYYETIIKGIFKESNFTSVNYIINTFEPMFHIDIFSSPKADRIKELDMIMNYKRREIKTIPKASLNDHYQHIQSDRKSKRKLLIKQQKKLLEDIQSKENQLVKCKETAEYYLSNLKIYQVALDKKQYHSKAISRLIPSPNGEDEEKEYVPLDSKLKEQLNERVVAFITKTFEPSLLHRIIGYWIDNCDKLKEIRKKNPYYYSNKHKSDNTEEKKKTKIKNTLQVKHVHRKPNPDVMFLIPYCSQKYTIVKRDTELIQFNQ